MQVGGRTHTLISLCRGNDTLFSTLFVSRRGRNKSFVVSNKGHARPCRTANSEHSCCSDIAHPKSGAWSARGGLWPTTNFTWYLIRSRPPEKYFRNICAWSWNAWGWQIEEIFYSKRTHVTVYTNLQTSVYRAAVPDCFLK